jgi:hypothetical protein
MEGMGERYLSISKEKTTSEIPAAESEQGREEKLFENMQFLIEMLNTEEQNGLRYAVVGGVAMAAYREQQEYQPLRENKTARDVDIYILDDPQNRMPEIERMLAERHSTQKGMMPPVSFNAVKEEDYASRTQLLGSLKKNGDGHSIVFRDVEKVLPNDIMALCEREVKFRGQSAAIKTFNAGVLLHLYITRIGSLKSKDRGKVTQFLRETPSLRAAGGKDPEEHRKYRVFHEFAREVREKYPVYASAIRLYSIVDDKFFGSLLSHRIIPEKLLQMLITL